MPLLRGIVIILLIACVTILVCIPLFSLGLVSLILPGAPGRQLKRSLEIWLFIWTGFNRFLFRATRLTDIRLSWPAMDTVSTDHWYLVISNHQSWSDILILQTILWNRIPPIKFFTKEQLIWIPFIGIGMYLLGFPYVKRSTKQQISKKPELKGADRESVRAACRRFREYPSTVLNFIEGTRITPAKQERQGSEFNRLLAPKVGGLSYVINDMGSTFHRMLDVTIHYPDRTPTFWEFLQGKCRHVDVVVDTHIFPAEVLAQGTEREQRRRLAGWIDTVWRAKDQRLEQLANGSTAS